MFNLIGTNSADLADAMNEFWNERSDYYFPCDTNVATAAASGAVPEDFRWLANHLTTNAAVVDFGCGNGQLYHYLTRLGVSVRYSGLDCSRQGISTCRKKYPEVSFEVCDLAHAPIATASQDFVVSTWVVEHLVSPQMVMHEMLRVLKPGGKILAINPFHDPHLSVPRSLKLGSRSLANKYGRRSVLNKVFYGINLGAYFMQRWYYEVVEAITKKPMFLLVLKPRCLEEHSFEWDWDLTHIVRTRALALFFQATDCDFERPKSLGNGPLGTENIWVATKRK